MILSAQECQCPLVDEGISLVNSPICTGTIYFMMVLEAFLKGRCNIATPCSRIQSVKEVRPKYDFIVIGAGSAGSIVADRLSENENFKVLLLEAGGQEPIGARPPSFYRTFWSNDQIDWRYRTVPDNYCLDQNGQGCVWPRGKVLGGSSLLNGMMYHRGHAADYEDWVKLGAEGWSWEENLPYFDKTEGNREIGTVVSAEYHSATGPLPVQQFKYQPHAAHVLLQAINETGFPIIQDMNNPNTPEGFTIAQTFNEDGQRYTTARAFLKPESERPNLHVKLNALVSKVLLVGNRAYGVEYIDENGEKQTVKASKEVILSAGALNTPQILMLSGIGPRETLKPLNIPVVADLPVGKFLKNHYGITLYFILTKINATEVLDWSVLTQYLLKREGPMSGTGVTQLTGLLYSSLADKSRKQPDLQFFFNGFYAECSRTGVIDETHDYNDGIGRNVSVLFPVASKAVASKPGVRLDHDPGIEANAALLLPRSYGYMTINSTDPTVSPLFYPGYFAHPEDLVMIRDGARYLQRIFDSDTLKNKYGIQLDSKTTERCKSFDEWSDAWIECMARVNTDPQNHQLATAAIGLVIDPQLKVYNVDRLRVIDASSMPSQPTGNPQGAIMMVAERGADLIKKQWS